MSMPTPGPGDSILPIEEAYLSDAVKRARAGDRCAFEELYKYYKKPIWRCIVQLIGDEESASDLFQETFLRVWKKLPETNDDLQFKPWLYRIAVNLGIDYLRSKKKMQNLSLDNLEKHSSRFSLQVRSHEEYISEMECLRLALFRLSPQLRTCLILQNVCGFSQKEVADILHISESCVSAYVSRGRYQLRRIFRSLADDEDTNKKGKLTS